MCATVLAVCAIVSSRLRHGATAGGQSENRDGTASKTFAQAAVQAFPRSLSRAVGFEYLRAKALLAILYIQYGDVRDHRTHLGEYDALCTNADFYNESRWGAGLTEPQLQERRRVVSTTSAKLTSSFGPHTL